MEGKKTKGRQKIEMKRIEDERFVTFSKRRSGIYKKASELVILTGAELAIVVFSPKGKPYSFAHPSIETIANRFLGRHQAPEDGLGTIIEAFRQNKVNKLIEQHNELELQLDEKKKAAEILKHRTKGLQAKGWWNTPIEGLNVEELRKMEHAFEELRASLCKKIGERTRASSSSSSGAPFAPPPQVIMNPFASSSRNNEINHITFPPKEDHGHGHLSFDTQTSFDPNHYITPGLDANRDREL